MATRFELVLEGEHESSLGAIAAEALDEIRLGEESWSLFCPGSLLAGVNREAARRPVRLDEPTFELLSIALGVSRESGGAFDPTVAPLMRSLGFHERGPVAGEPRWGAEHVHLDPATRTVRFDLEGIELDLGGIAKGYALDLAAEVLREHGVARALLHGGTSSVVAIGAPLGQPGWQVALAEEPDAPRAQLRDAALATSAPHGRTVEREGRKLGHVLDPAAGASACGAMVVAVIAPRAVDADAWSTALLAAGERDLDLPAEVTALRRFDSTWTTSGATSPPDSCFSLSPSSSLPTPSGAPA